MTGIFNSYGWGAVSQRDIGLFQLLEEILGFEDRLIGSSQLGTVEYSRIQQLGP